MQYATRAERQSKMGKNIDVIIKKAGGAAYGVYRPKKEIDPDSGSDVITIPDSPSFEILAYIQPTGASGSVKGVSLKNTTSGDETIADYYMYHSNQVKSKDRVLFDGLFYEIRSTEKWKASYMEYFKSYLVKVDGQDED